MVVVVHVLVGSMRRTLSRCRCPTIRDPVSFPEEENVWPEMDDDDKNDDDMSDDTITNDDGRVGRNCRVAI